jgi:hypothetical protein
MRALVILFSLGSIALVAELYTLQAWLTPHACVFAH